MCEDIASESVFYIRVLQIRVLLGHNMAATRIQMCISDIARFTHSKNLDLII